ncbi:MAG: hypothetical protein Q8N15_03310, partial [Bacillota bacterium]|nr:hypothetical protein [Bacillota bacterium]
LYILFLSLYFKTWKFMLLFAQVALFSVFADFWGVTVFASFAPTGLLVFGTFLVSAIAIPLGSAILIRTKLPAGIFDELMFFTAHVTKLKLSVARTLNESLIVGLAIAIGYATGNGLGEVGLGSIAYAFSVGWILKGILLLFERIFPGRESA